MKTVVLLRSDTIHSISLTLKEVAQALRLLGLADENVRLRVDISCATDGEPGRGRGGV